MRLSGYYWIRSRSQPALGSGRWMIGEWREERWFITASDECWSESVLEFQVGPRIESPAEPTHVSGCFWFAGAECTCKKP